MRCQTVTFTAAAATTMLSGYLGKSSHILHRRERRAKMDWANEPLDSPKKESGGGGKKRHSSIERYVDFAADFAGGLAQEGKLTHYSL